MVGDELKQGRIKTRLEGKGESESESEREGKTYVQLFPALGRSV